MYLNRTGYTPATHKQSYDNEWSIWGNPGRVVRLVEKLDNRKSHANALHLLLFGTPRPSTRDADDQLEKECAMLRSVVEEIKRICVELSIFLRYLLNPMLTIQQYLDITNQVIGLTELLDERRSKAAELHIHLYGFPRPVCCILISRLTNMRMYDTLILLLLLL